MEGPRGMVSLSVKSLLVGLPWVDPDDEAIKGLPLLTVAKRDNEIHISYCRPHTQIDIEHFDWLVWLSDTGRSKKIHLDHEHKVLTLDTWHLKSAERRKVIYAVTHYCVATNRVVLRWPD